MFKSIQCVFVAVMSVGFAAQPTLCAAEPADSQTPASAFRLGAPFRDGAVLQRGMKVPVWSWSKPGTKVTVEFAPQHGAGQAGQENSAKADKSGKWMVWLDPVYFHQFYSPGDSSKPNINSWSEMRLGTWLARDIPHAGMASQIDIGGAVHYRKLIRKSHRHRRYLYRWQRRSHRTTHRRIGAGECSVEGDVKMEVE